MTATTANTKTVGREDRHALAAAQWGTETPITYVDTSDEDLRTAVLAEHVKVDRTGDGNFLAVEVTFDFLCPNCGKRHWATELDNNPVFSTVGWQLACGAVTVRMPWAATSVRDSKSIYGQK